jgi:hypothetical protein
MPPGMTPHGMTPPPGMVQQMPPPSTLGQSVGQVGAPAGGKGKGGIIAVAVVAVVAGGGGAYAVFGRGGDQPKPVATVADAGKRVVLADVPDAAAGIASIPPDARVEIVTVEIDAGVVKVVPVSDEVTISFDIVYDQRPKALDGASITVDGKVIEGTTLKVKKGSARIKVEVRQRGYEKGKAEFVPDKDRTVSVPLKKESGGVAPAKCDKKCKPPRADDCKCCPIC